MLQQQTALHRADGPSSLRAVPDQQERESMRGRGSPCAETKCARAETQWTEPWWHYRVQNIHFRTKTLSQSKFSFRVKSSQVKSSQGCRMVVCCLCIDLTRDSFRHPRTPARRIYLQMFTSDRGENTREAGHTVKHGHGEEDLHHRLMDARASLISAIAGEHVRARKVESCRDKREEL